MARYTVSQLTGEIGALLTSTFDDVEVEGEVSGFKVHSSGHWYFSLKDGDAVIACAMFRTWNSKMRRQPREGERLVARGSVDVYAQRGTYSFIVRGLTALGVGELLRRLNELKARLGAEGLFDVARKRPLPSLPRAIGVATSPTGAAFQDILRVVRHRFPSMPIYLAPCRVQGEGAAAEVAQAIELLNRHGRSDVLIVGRGGGSAEDLWCFNEEIVVRAIVASRIPIVSAVGHEVDTALSDFAADVRAATPSHAAELVTPVRDELLRRVQTLEVRSKAAMQRRVQLLREKVRRVRLLHPRQRVERGRLRLDELQERLGEAATRALVFRRARLTALGRQLDVLSPAGGIERSRRRLGELDERLGEATTRGLVLRRARLTALARQLDVLSPVAVLDRGYAIVSHEGRAVADANTVAVGDRVEIRLAWGRLGAEVREKSG